MEQLLLISILNTQIFRKKCMIYAKKGRLQFTVKIISNYISTYIYIYIYIKYN